MEMQEGGREVGAELLKPREVVMAKVIDEVIKEDLRIKEKPGITILDVGTGDQLVAEEMKEKGYEMTSLDPVDYRRVKDGPCFLIAKGEELPFENSSFDYVTLVFTLHHTKEPEKLIKESLRVAKKGVIIIENDVAGWRRLPTFVLDQIEPVAKRLPFCRHIKTEKEWERILAQSILGMERVRMEEAGRFTLQGFWRNVVFRIEKM